MSAAYCLIVPNTGSMALIYAMQMIGGLGQSVVMTLTMSLAVGGFPLSKRSSAMGAYQSVYSLGMTLGPVIMGGLLDIFGQYSYACCVILIVCVAGLIISVTAVKKTMPAAINGTG
jgi:MFS family permease